MTHRDQKIYRFSEAPIWELQRTYYEEQGIGAWQSEEVPQYITSNPSIAVAYAEIIFGFLQDRAKLGYTLEPVTILELGAGSGRLAYHIVKELCELRDYASITLPPFRYVMSDLAFKNITFWQQHRSLLPFVEQGVLDFAQFDAVEFQLNRYVLLSSCSKHRVRRLCLGRLRASRSALSLVSNMLMAVLPSAAFVMRSRISAAILLFRWTAGRASIASNQRMKVG